MALLPDLDLRRAHLLITKTLLTVYDIDLASNSGSDESIHAQASAGIGKDRSVDFKANFNAVPIRTWLPAEWKGRLNGTAFGDLRSAGKDPKLESSSGEGSLRIRDGRIDDVPLLEKLAELAQKKSFEHLDLMIVRSLLRGAIRRIRHQGHHYRRERQIPDRGRDLYRAPSFARHDQAWAYP